MKKKPAYNKKFYNSIFGKIYIRVTNKIVHLYNIFVDIKICKRSLNKYVPSIDEDKYTASQPTAYWILEQVFDGIMFTPEDKIIDVGCAKGRVIAFLLKSNFPGEITGIELNENVAEICRSWTVNHKNVNVINGDVFDINLNQFNIQYLFRPFQTEVFEAFINKTEAELTHPITLIYMSDSHSNTYLKDRKGWSLVRRNWIFKKYMLCLSYSPQRFSIWEYNPN